MRTWYILIAPRTIKICVLFTCARLSLCTFDLKANALCLPVRASTSDNLTPGWPSWPALKAQQVQSSSSSLFSFSSFYSSSSTYFSSNLSSFSSSSTLSSSSSSSSWWLNSPHLSVTQLFSFHPTCSLFPFTSSCRSRCFTIKLPCSPSTDEGADDSSSRQTRF